MKKQITINNRELLRNYRHYREQLLSGEVKRIIIPVNGKSIYFAAMPSKTRPGDIRPLLEKLSIGGEEKRISTVRASGEITSLVFKKIHHLKSTKGK